MKKKLVEVGQGISAWSRIHASGEHGEEEPVVPAIESQIQPLKSVNRTNCPTN
jgi:hypothetical protein